MSTTPSRQGKERVWGGRKLLMAKAPACFNITQWASYPRRQVFLQRGLLVILSCFQHFPHFGGNVSGHSWFWVWSYRKPWCQWLFMLVPWPPCSRHAFRTENADRDPSIGFFLIYEFCLGYTSRRACRKMAFSYHWVPHLDCTQRSPWNQTLSGNLGCGVTPSMERGPSPLVPGSQRQCPGVCVMCSELVFFPFLSLCPVFSFCLSVSVYAHLHTCFSHFSENTLVAPDL